MVTPLQTILCPVRYPFATAKVNNGSIVRTLSYQSSLEKCYAETKGWVAHFSDPNYIMVEQKEIEGKSYWVAV